MMARTRAGYPIDEVALITHRLAVLLSAGVSPVSAWGYLLSPESSDPAQSPDSRDPPRGAAEVIRGAAFAGAAGDSIADAVAVEARRLGGAAGDAWMSLAAAWAVATSAGSPLAACLRDLASSFRDVGQLQRDVDVALAGPAATARMVTALPVVGVVFGMLMGFDTLAVLLGTLPGLLSLASGAALLLAGHRWNRGLVRRAHTTDATPGLELDLMAIAMTGGGSTDRARSLVRSAQERFGVGTTGRDDRVSQVLDLSTRAGVPAAELLRSEADQRRRDARSDGQRRAARLAVTLMLPLGSCVLPAFMLIGVVPLLLSVLSSTIGRV